MRRALTAVASIGWCFSILTASQIQAQVGGLLLTKGKIVLPEGKVGADKIVFKAEAGIAAIAPSFELQTLRVTVAGLTQVIPPGGLERKDSASKTLWRYRGDAGGLSALIIKRKGFELQFKGVAKKLDLVEPMNPIALSIEVGSDVSSWQGFYEIRRSASKTLFKYPASRKGDGDGDGISPRDGDCDDQNPAAGPGSIEVCDLADNDCDGAIDEGLATVVGGIDTGLCRSEVQGCLGGTVTIVQTGVGPQPEICDDGLDQDCDGSDCARLQLTITEPLPGAVTGVAAIDVSGTVSPSATSAQVNGVGAVLAGGSFTATSVPLREGGNLVTATAYDPTGRVATGSVSVILDLTPPTLAITSPADGATLASPSVAVVGLVNDIVAGTVNAPQAQVICNGVAATVANRTFAVMLELPVGSNTIECQATDQVGNGAATSVDVLVDPTVQRQIIPVSGEMQSGVIGTQLGSPLVVRVVDDGGQPVTATTAIFRVVQNDGLVQASGDPARSVAVQTDGAGEASVTWTLGSRAGAGLNRVQVTAPGFPGEVVFSASADTGPPGLVVADAGDHQRGIVGERLAEPLVAVVVDAGSNRIEGVPVTFSVVDGGGSFAGQPATTVVTDSDGRARVFLALGPQVGVENNVVEATYDGNVGFPASFSASAHAPGNAADTRVSGIVLDNSERPVPGATVLIGAAFEGSAMLATSTDGAGKFAFESVVPGHAALIVDGSTTSRSGVWPELRFEIECVPGQDNTVTRGPIYMLPLNLEEAVTVDETTGGTLTLEQVPGFSLEIAPGSVTFLDGSRSGLVSATLVHSDKVPMTPAFGQQPRFIITIQPAGARFDPPAKLTLPNTDGLAPGQITEMYSFDHDLNMFVAIGTGSVSDDGSVIVSDPGVGIQKAGWHCGGDPNRTGSVATCPQCHRCFFNFCLPVDSDGCEDGDLCTRGDTCSFGACLSGEPVDCDDDNQCTDDTCEIGVCRHVNSRLGGVDQCDGCSDGTACDDGDPCTVNDRCEGEVCTGGQPKDCDDDDLCTEDSCDSGVGCKNDAEAVDCDDGNECTDDVCFADKGCQSINTRNGAADQCDGCADDTPCSDSDECTADDKCTDGACVPGPPPDCDDENDCTDDSCDTASGCVNENSRAGQPEQCEGCANDTPCSDENLCTAEDRCADDACVAGEPLDCDDESDCTQDDCDELQGCTNEPRDGDCDDEDACTPEDTCSDGMCMGSGSTCGDGMFQADCEEECDGDAAPDCPNSCSEDCRCCDVELQITEPEPGARLCVGDVVVVRGTVSEDVVVLVEGEPATVNGQEWSAVLRAPDEPGEVTVDALVDDAGCSTKDEVPVTVIAVAKLEALDSELVDDGDGDADTSTYLAAVRPGQPLTIKATADPATAEPFLPECWSLTGEIQVDRLTMVTPAEVTGEEIFIASAGSSRKTTSVVFVDAEFKVHPDQVYGFSPPTHLDIGLISNVIPTKSIKVGATDLMQILVEPEDGGARVFVSPQEPAFLDVPISEFEGGLSTFALQGLVKGRSHLDVSVGTESGPINTAAKAEVRVYEERILSVGIRRVIEDNDDVPLAPPLCVGAGANAVLDSRRGGDDQHVVHAGNPAIGSGPNGICDSSANATDLVPRSLQSGEAALVGYLNDTVYDQAVVRWEPTFLPDVEANYDVDLDGRLNTGDPDAPNIEFAILATAADVLLYDKMIYIVNDYAFPPSGMVVCGICNFGSRHCAIFTGCLAATSCTPANVAAHELGHSLTLRHTPFDGANLMFPDCSNQGTALRAYQWDKSNP